MLLSWWCRQQPRHYARPLITTRIHLIRTLVTQPQQQRSVFNKNGWEAIIGVEVHAQIDSKTKLFSDMETSYEEPPNSKVSMVDLAFPGVQPRLNERCVELAVKTALALKADVQPRSRFDRKHYFYPDLPQGYQITQQREPIARGGMIALTQLDGVPEPFIVGLHQIQLEQDTGKSMHDMIVASTLLDMNRAGTGLMEIVTQPDLRSSFEAGLLVKKLQSILQCVGSSQASMNEGSMRCDVNVSVHRQGEPFGTRCEIKNLNSVRFLSMAIDAEIERQIQLIENGGVVKAETRGFDVGAKKTLKLRSKETAPDYRYMPEPDLPPLVLTNTYIESLSHELPELPDETRARIMERYNMSLDDAHALLNEPGSLAFFEKVCQGRNPQAVLNWTVNDLFGELAKREIPFTKSPISIEQMGSLVDLVQSNKITGKIGKDVLRTMLEQETDMMPQEIVDRKGWARIDDSDLLKNLCGDLMTKHPDQVAKFQNGEMKVFKWFIGQIMRKTKGMADPVQINKALCEALGCKSEDIAAAEARGPTDKKKGGSGKQQQQQTKKDSKKSSSSS
ncbi:Aspartyl/glutamyl-tRNA amidotransferase subunit B [Zychaea mexicana]|uniref:Aspartyl/glutamyl-tRNA amidotransferase subunit B n=1 Tax=Zychaea mexicana TaxID=64656 RepID=UPI0022FF343B|nr:Aspartyl/glutamyl-tRNA amidotransferase subunit B [Zychaea mexicana]KAI9490523.1 Aspartyl/glutamyl-tRNA amidotransferase subunit B [Zychaea mexicana]